jgi:hypothetical protein
MELVKDSLGKRDARHLEEKKGFKPTVFPMDSYVLAEKLADFTSRKETCKLKPILKGPFRVVAVNEDLTQYTVQNLITSRLRVYHVKRLRAFKCDPTGRDPTVFAARDDDLVAVEAVLDYRPRTFKATMSRKLLELQVRWLDDKRTSWEPWSKVRRLATVRRWAESHKTKVIRNLIPVNEKQEEEESDDDHERLEEAHGD